MRRVRKRSCSLLRMSGQSEMDVSSAKARWRSGKLTLVVEIRRSQRGTVRHGMPVDVHELISVEPFSDVASGDAAGAD